MIFIYWPAVLSHFSKKARSLNLRVYVYASNRSG
jgi:hypothetical protein